MTTMNDRGDVEDYYPHYVNPDDVEFDYAYYECNCGWQSETQNHPSKTEYYADQHSRFGRTPDCGLGKHIIVFKDGSTATL